MFEMRFNKKIHLLTNDTMHSLYSEENFKMPLICYRIHLSPYQGLFSDAFQIVKNLNKSEMINYKRKLFYESLMKKISFFNQNPQTTQKNKSYSACLVWENNEHSLIFFRFGKERETEILNNEFHVSGKIKNWDVFLDVLVDLKDQIIAVDKNASLSFDMFEKTFFNQVKKLVANQNIELSFHPMADKTSYWDFIKENQGNISELRVEVFAPNMPASSRSAGRLLNDLRSDFKATSTKLTAVNSQGKLNMSEENEDVQSFAELSKDGIAEVEIKSLSRNGQPAKIYSSTSGEAQKCINFEKKKLDSTCDSGDYSYLEQLFAEIRKLL